MEVFIINFYAEKFDGSGDNGSQYVLVDAFKTYDATIEYVKNQFIPSIIKETKGFYPDEEIDVRILYEQDGSWTLGVFEKEYNEQIEVMTIDINKVIVND